MRTEAALQVGFCALCVMLALLGEGMYVFCILGQRSIAMSQFTELYRAFIQGDSSFPILRQWIVFGAAGPHGVPVILAPTPG